MTYGEAVHYIEEIPKFTKKTALAHTERLLDELGHPEEGIFGEAVAVVHELCQESRCPCIYVLISGRVIIEAVPQVGVYFQQRLFRQTLSVTGFNALV